MENPNNSVLIQFATLADIEAIVNRAVDARMEEFYKRISSRESVPVRRKEAAALLGVSLPTLDNYGKHGLLHPRHAGGRVFYDRQELLDWLSR